MTPLVPGVTALLDRVRAEVQRQHPGAEVRAEVAQVGSQYVASCAAQSRRRPFHLLVSHFAWARSKRGAASALARSIGMRVQ